MKRANRKLLGWCLAAALLLSGCAANYVLHNTVQSFSHLAALPSQPTYRFERLPSQQDPLHAQLEAFADGPLYRAGLRRDDAKPAYTVQVSAQVNAVLSPWASSYGWGWGWGGWGGYHRGMGWGFGGSWPMEPPWYHRVVSVIVRDVPSNRVVFESSASNDSPWIEPAQVFVAMFDAALQGFPQPPAGPRQVEIPIGR